VNGVVVRALGARADALSDTVAVDGTRLPRARPSRTLILHKPRGVVSTLRDPEGRPTVRSLLRGVAERLYPVGRLDLNTTGLLLLTNDGALAHALLHPRQGVARVYHAKVSGRPDAIALARLGRGVRLADGGTASALARVLESLPTKTWLEITVHQGRWHHVRRLCEAIGHPVEKLARVRFGPLALGRLPPGTWRDLSPAEVGWLREAAGLSAGARTAGEARSRGSGPPPRRRRARPGSPPRDGRRTAPPPRGEPRPRAPRPRPRPHRS